MYNIINYNYAYFTEINNIFDKVYIFINLLQSIYIRMRYLLITLYYFCVQIQSKTFILPGDLFFFIKAINFLFYIVIIRENTSAADIGEGEHAPLTTPPPSGNGNAILCSLI